MKIVIQLMLGLVMVVYPFAVVWALKQGYLLWASVALMVIAVVRYILKPNTLFAPLTILAVLCGAFSLSLEHELGLKLYPVLMSVGALGIFAFTLAYPPSMIERFARLHQPDLPKSGIRWTRNVTKVWCGFFLINALIALATVLWANQEVWAIYNGFISYVLMGILLLGEWLLRKRYQTKSIRETEKNDDHLS